MNTDEVRAKFEKWYLFRFGEGIPEGVFWSDEMGGYATGDIEHLPDMDRMVELHDGWQMAYQQATKDNAAEIERLKTSIGYGIRFVEADQINAAIGELNAALRYERDVERERIEALKEANHGT